MTRVGGQRQRDNMLKLFKNSGKFRLADRKVRRFAEEGFYTIIPHNHKRGEDYREIVLVLYEFRRNSFLVWHPNTGASKQYSGMRLTEGNL